MEFIDLKAQYKVLKNDIDTNISQVIATSRFIGGPFVNHFEEELAKYVGRKHCISCASGTDALQLAFMAYGIGEGDAVFCPDMTFIASIEPACMLGATPVFCDIDIDTYNINPDSLEERIKEVIKAGRLKPKAVVAVDFLGNPAKHEEIEKICNNYGLIHIEDGAQSTGSIYHGRKCGAWGDIATTSFFPSKPLGCYGDGGAVFTDDDEIAGLINSFKVHGKGPKGKYDNIRIGINSRLDAIQAAILLPKLMILSEEVDKRQEVAKTYDNAFRDKLVVPVVEDDSVSAYAQYCLLAEDENQRTKIINAMESAGIPSLIYYPNTLHSMKAFESCNDEFFVNSEQYAKRNFGVPFSPYLTHEDQMLVINTIINAL